MEWYYLRPDALFGLDLVADTLKSYVKIVRKEIPPRFKVMKSFEIEIPKENLGIKDLIDIHDDNLKEFVKYYNKIKKGKEEFEEKDVKFSLLDLKIRIAKEILKRCEFCERKCKVNRLKEKGFCGVKDKPKIASEFIHLGEESWITPSHTIFFAGCNFKCIYCQNWDISQNPENGIYMEPKTLTKIIELRFQEGARNINWVGGEPTPNIHYILEVLKYVRSDIAVIWNSNAYESITGQKLIAGVIDLYLYDFKYGNNECALKYSKVPKYFETVTRNFKIAFKYGEISFRHLVLPNHLECCSFNIIDWISKNFGDKVVVNIMDQYRPEYKASEYKEINRSITKEEYFRVLDYAKRKRLKVIT